MATLKSYKKSEFEKLLHPVRSNTLSYEIMAKIYRGSKFIDIGQVFNVVEGHAYISKFRLMNEAFISSQDAYRAKKMITSNRVAGDRATFIVVTRGRMDKLLKRNSEKQPTREQRYGR